jgi:hypothetical protein
MSPKSFRWIFVGLLLASWMTAVLSESQITGAAAVWSNGRYRFSGGTQPWLLAFALLIVIAYCISMTTTVAEPGPPLPGLARRFLAFWLDFIFAMTAVAPVIGILPVVVEWRRTGVFAWAFQRDTPSAGDQRSLFGSVGLSLVILFVYYLVPLIRRRPSPGACIVGYQIVSDEGRSLTVEDAVMRTLLGIVALVGWVVAPFLYREPKKGKFWLDRVFNTRAVLL